VSIKLLIDLGLIMTRLRPLLFAILIASILSACNNRSVAITLSPTATVPIPTATAVVVVNTPIVSPVPTIAVVGAPEGWQILKSSADNTCQVSVPSNWSIDAQSSLASENKPDGTIVEVTIAPAKVGDWPGFKQSQINAGHPTTVVENSDARLWFEVMGDGKTAPVGTLGMTVAVKGTNNKYCMAIMGVIGSATVDDHDLFKLIAPTVTVAQ
jgi:hypothetical protein